MKKTLLMTSTDLLDTLQIVSFMKEMETRKHPHDIDVDYCFECDALLNNMTLSIQKTHGLYKVTLDQTMFIWLKSKLTGYLRLLIATKEYQAIARCEDLLSLIGVAIHVVNVAIGGR